MILELKNVSRSFGEKDERITVLKDISLIMRQGEFIALSGESGTGKTTLLGIISLNDTYSHVNARMSPARLYASG